MTDKNFYQTLLQATSGNVDAIGDILELYLPLINQYSYIEGKLDEDLKQQILLRIFENIQNFKI